MTRRVTAIGIFLLAVLNAEAVESSLRVSGLVAHPLRLSLADLAAYPQHHVTATQVSGRGPVALDCNGPTVAALLEKATLSLGKDRNANLAHSLLVTADDGYAVALSLGELDPDYGNAGAIIAASCDGKKLDAPRLVMPNDKHGGRAVKGVVSIEVK